MINMKIKSVYKNIFSIWKFVNENMKINNAKLL